MSALLPLSRCSEKSRGTEDAVGIFNITVPAQDLYSIFFISSTSQFIGALEINNEVITINAGDEVIDLGEITLQNGMAVLSNEQDLLGIAAPSGFQDLNDIVYNQKTSRICSFIYNPMNEGDITVYQGCGNCDPAETGNNLGMSICSYEYDEDLNRMVAAVQHYKIITGINEYLATAITGDKIFWYVTETGMVQYKIRRASGTVEAGAGQIPDFLEVGKTYSGNNYRIAILNIFNETAFPSLDNLLLDGFVMKVEAGNDVRYNWIAKEIGEALYSTTNSNIDLGNNIRMKVIFKKTGNRLFGTPPEWMTYEFMNYLLNGPNEPPESENLIKLFDSVSYLPVYKDVYWEYSDGMGAYIYNVDTVKNTFNIFSA